MRYDHRNDEAEYLALGFLMKLHSFANPHIFIGQFLQKTSSKKKREKEENPPASHYWVSFISFDLTYHASVPWQ